MELVDMLESAWFFSNVCTTKLTNQSNRNLSTNFKQKSPEPIEFTNPIPQNQLKSPEVSNQSNSPKPPKHSIHHLAEVPVRSSVVPEVSMSPRRREEDERRILRRRQRIYSNRGICRDLKLEEEIGICRNGDIKSVATCKDERTIKRHLKTWAVAVAVASSVSQSSPMVALCC